MIIQFRNFIDKQKNKIHTNKNYLISYAIVSEDLDIEKLLQIFDKKLNQFFYWAKPNDKQLIIASEPLIKFSSEINSNPPYLISNDLNFETDIIDNWKDFPDCSFPLIVGASKFSKNEKPDIWTDFENSNWHIPKTLYYKDRNRYYLIFNFIVNEKSIETIEAEFSKNLNLIYSEMEFKVVEASEGTRETEKNIYEKGYDDWKEKINRSLKEISDGKISKVVISRRIEKKLTAQPSIARLLKNLSKDYQNCYIFANKKNESIFFGASPEKLITFNDGIIETEALAGSIKRSKDLGEDRDLQLCLLSDKKNVNEYLEVLEFILEALKPYSESIEYEPTPIIKKLPNIQHLWSPVRASLKHKMNIQEIVGNLHPTPAICGTPRNEALKLIAELENYPRGLFSGIIGWYNFDVQGEFAIAIRSALIKNKHVYAYAGCGIVDGSKPLEEYEETKLKLRPILSIFENENIYKS